jgi:DNA (cytosine-5)-methyltransferase 1
LDAAPIWTNLKTFPWAEFRGKVDILSGGYPCQPFSAAGKRLGTEDPRHLWPFIADGIRAMQPRLCFFENVEGHITLGLKEVISELESIGYRTTWGIFSAREVGAPHRRKRIFILAYSDSFRHNWPISNSINKWIVQEQTLIESKQSLVWSKIEGCSNELFDSDNNGYTTAEVGESIDEGKVAGQTQQIKTGEFEGSSSSSGRNELLANCESELLNSNDTHDQRSNVSCGIQKKYPVVGDSGWWQTERGLGRVADGHPYWVDRLRLCGNGVVPSTATLAFKTLFKRFI